MISTPPSSTTFAYIDCDVPAEQTLAEWRRDLNAARLAELPVRRTFRLLQLRRARWAT